MLVDVAISAGHIMPEQTAGKLVVVIDVLRATSVICTGLMNGAKAFIPVSSIEEAVQLKSKNTLLAGERDGFKIDGFDLGNSPLEYVSEIVKDKTIILTTTNGTRAINNSSNAHELIIASFLNLEAVCTYILQQDKDVCLVCAGTKNNFSLDDAMCSGNIISLLMKYAPKTELSDAAFAHLNIYDSNNKSDLHKALNDGCKHYCYLNNNGFSDDLQCCLKKNTSIIVPKFSNHKIQ